MIHHLLVRGLGLVLFAVWTCAFAADVPQGFTFDQDVSYGSDSAAQKLDILYPAAETSARPAIVIIHGGGWYAGNKGGERTFAMMRAFAEAGFVAADINYRLSDEAKFPAAIDDCKRAVQWLRSHAATYRIDPSRIGAMGGSAGGHLSAMLAVTRPEDGFKADATENAPSSAIQAAVPICPPTDLRIPLSRHWHEKPDSAVMRFLGGAPEEKPDAARRASPVVYVRRESPPLLILHGTADRRVEPEQAIALADAMKAAGAPCELVLVEGGKHGMDIAREEAGFNRILAFFRQHLLPGN